MEVRWCLNGIDGSKNVLKGNHSAMIGFLINPNAHEAGAYCFQEFMKLLPADRVGTLRHEPIKTVALEYDLGPVAMKGAGWGRGAQLRRWRCARQRGILSTDKISGRMDFAR